MSDTRREIILATVGDLATSFLGRDRKDDVELPRGAIEEAIEAGEITWSEIVARFATELMEELKR